MDLDRHSASQLGDHVLHELNNLQVVLQLVDVRLHLVNGLALLGHKLLVILDVLLNGVKEQVHGLFLLCLVFSCLMFLFLLFLCRRRFVVFALSRKEFLPEMRQTLSSCVCHGGFAK